MPLMRAARLARAPILPLMCKEHSDCVAPERCDCEFMTLKICCELPGFPANIPIPIPVPVFDPA